MAQANVGCSSCDQLLDELQGLRLALEHRDVIGQAKGILMAQSHFDADAAFSVLVRASQRQNRKLYDIAAELVANTARGRDAQSDSQSADGAAPGHTTKGGAVSVVPLR